MWIWWYFTIRAFILSALPQKKSSTNRCLHNLREKSLPMPIHQWVGFLCVCSAGLFLCVDFCLFCHLAAVKGAVSSGSWPFFVDLSLQSLHTAPAEQTQTPTLGHSLPSFRFLGRSKIIIYWPWVRVFTNDCIQKPGRGPTERKEFWGHALTEHCFSSKPKCHRYSTPIRTVFDVRNSSWVKSIKDYIRILCCPLFEVVNHFSVKINRSDKPQNWHFRKRKHCGLY